MTMKKMMRVMLVLTVMLMAGVAAEAQVHKVFIHQDGKEGIDVVDALRARIGAGSRYALTDNTLEAELMFFVVCATTALAHGFACSAAMILSSSRFPPLSMPFAGPYIAIGPDAVGVAKIIFEDFVSATTDENIKTGEEVLLQSVTVFCKNPANKKTCQP
jgi:hypothetical protein